MKHTKLNDPRAAQQLHSKVFATLVPPEGFGRSYPSVVTNQRPPLLQMLMSVFRFGRATQEETHSKPSHLAHERREERGSGSW